MLVCVGQDSYKNKPLLKNCETLESRSTSNKLINWVLIKKISKWTNRYRQRKALAKLNNRMLDDIGYSYQQAKQESDKPFWK